MILIRLVGRFSKNKSCIRHYSSTKNNGVIVGVFNDDNPTLTRNGQQYDQQSNGWLSKILPLAGKHLKQGSAQILYNPNAESNTVCLVGLGSLDKNNCEYEGRDEVKQSIREAISVGTRALRDVCVDNIQVDDCGDPQVASEGAYLGLYSFDDMKTSEKKNFPVQIGIFGDSSNSESWETGKTMAEGQNLARRLMETPANHMTPTLFADVASEALSKAGAQVIVRDEEWVRSKNMGAYLCVDQGSEQPLKFLEIDYKGHKKDHIDVSFVGKGVTFDAGGISLKPSKDMDKMRADMGGAACTVGTISAIAKLNLPLHVKGFIPLCENLPSHKAVKPGDVVTAMNGKTIQVDNTDAEGRLLLADALHYASLMKPHFLIDMATLTGAMSVALGSGASGVFTRSNQLWNMLSTASYTTGDRVWRMPLWKHYVDQMKYGVADINNISNAGPAGGSCTAAGFLSEFVHSDAPVWGHIDIAGVMEAKNDKLLKSGMAGRPTRTLIQFAKLLAERPT